MISRVLGELSFVATHPRELAATTAQARWHELADVIRAGMDRVHAVLEDSTAGRGNAVCVYLEPNEEGCVLVTGVEISGAFEPRDGVEPYTTPDGRAATVAYFGEYEGLGPAHDALAEFCAAAGFPESGPSWEVYGDWDDDPERRRTDLFRLLPRS